jgi:hypothetical protein
MYRLKGGGESMNNRKDVIVKIVKYIVIGFVLCFCFCIGSNLVTHYSNKEVPAWANDPAQLDKICHPSDQKNYDIKVIGEKGLNGSCWYLVNGERNDDLGDEYHDEYSFTGVRILPSSDSIAPIRGNIVDYQNLYFH